MGRSAPLLLPAALAAPWLACAKPDSQLTVLDPVAVVAPDSLDFGGVVVPYDAALTVELINAGRATLEVEALTLEGSGAAMYTVSPATASVEPDDSVPVVVTFQPGTYLPYPAELVVSSNDPVNPTLRVPIAGEGIDGDVPQVAVDRLSVDFGEVEVGARTQGVFTVSNAGGGSLEIDAASALGEAGAFTLVSDPAGQTLAPGASFPVVVEYAPTTLDGDLSEYTLLTNDPEHPSISVVLVGNGGGEYPVAVIDAPTDVAPLDTIVLNGSGSYDPAGYLPLTYDWTLVDGPAASTTALSDTSTAAPSVFVDAAGIYTFALQVENAIGLRSEPASHTFAAVPQEDLYVLLSWNTGNSDLDLHLVRDDIASYFVDPEDCCYCNPNPDWGDGSSEDDDPTLALDNRVGYGPENINIEDPAAGDYYIRVHYFKDNSAGETEATVRLYIGGEQVQSWSRVLSYNQVWEVAGISFPDAVIVDEDADPYESPYRSCQ